MLAIAAVIVLAQPPCAGAESRYAAMIVDANTGRVLHADAADQPRYPASLTKVMTLYLVFEQMQLGRLSPDTMIRISPEAASAPPSRLGLKPGSSIALGDAIRVLVTKSANDIAVAVAEHIAGSEERFAEMMTRKAHVLGMKHTTFRNPSGLPDREQTTTARDMITLALRLYDTFPREAHYFSVRSFSYAGRNFRNHNTMLFNFAGMDGIKTGYTRASGFNLLASVHRDGRHVIGIVLGGTSASARNARMRLLLSSALQKASTEKTRHRLVIAARPTKPPRLAVRPAAAVEPARRHRSPPAPRLVEPVAAAREAASDAAPARGTRDTWQSEVRMAMPLAPGSSVASRLGVDNDWQQTVEPGPARRPSTLQAQASRLAAFGGPAMAPSIAHPPASVGGRAEIQIGAFSYEAEARHRLESVRRLAPDLLGNAQTAVPQVTVGRRRLYRARFIGLDARQAATVCADLERRRINCIVARPE